MFTNNKDTKKNILISIIVLGLLLWVILDISFIFWIAIYLLFFQ